MSLQPGLSTDVRTGTGTPGPPPAAGPPGVRTAPSPGVLVLRVLGLAGLLLLVGLGAASLVVGFLENRREDTRTLEGPVRVLDVDTATGDVVVRTGPAGSASTVTTRRHWSLTEPTATTSVEAGTARLRGACPTGWSLLSRCAVDFDVTVPAGTAVRVTTATGDTRIVGATGDVRVQTSTGDVRLTDARASTVQAQTATGDVRLEFTAAPDDVRARAATGDVLVRVPDDATVYQVTTSVGVGDRTVEVPRSDTSSHRVDVSTSVGDVTVTTSGPASIG